VILFVASALRSGGECPFKFTRRWRTIAWSTERVARPVSIRRVIRPPGADWAPRAQFGQHNCHRVAAWSAAGALAGAIDGELGAGRRAARPLVQSAGCRGARRARNSTMCIGTRSHHPPLGTAGARREGGRPARRACGRAALGRAHLDAPLGRRGAGVTRRSSRCAALPPIRIVVCTCGGMPASTAAALVLLPPPCLPPGLGCTVVTGGA